MAQTEFEISSLPGTKFRVGKISPTSLLAITTQIDFDKFKQTEVLFTFALEHLECLPDATTNNWVPVKVAGRDIYMPLGIEENLTALNELITWFLENIIAKNFTKSSV